MSIKEDTGFVRNQTFTIEYTLIFERRWNFVKNMNYVVNPYNLSIICLRTRLVDTEGIKNLEDTKISNAKANLVRYRCKIK